jgi:hypothetical protein
MAGESQILDNPAAGGEAKINFLVGPDGKFAENWRTQLPEDIREHKELVNVKDIQTLAKNHVNVQALIAKKAEGMVKVPGENASEEEIAAYRKATGVPDSPEAYAYTVPADFPKDIPFDQKRFDDFRAVAFKAGMNQVTFEAAVNHEITRQIAEYNALNTAAENLAKQTTEQLKKEHGTGYDAWLAKAKLAYSKIPEMVEIAKLTGMGDHPVFLKLAGWIGEHINEGSFEKGSGPSGDKGNFLDNLYPDE